jgi:hypothetical protein
MMNIKGFVTAGLIIAGVALSLAANATDGVRVKVLLMEALSNTSGSASGIVEGQEADKIHEVTGSNEPTRCVVTTIKRFKEAGCSRLSVKLIQPNTPTQQGTKTDFTLNYEINLCQNGRPPLDTTE